MVRHRALACDEHGTLLLMDKKTVRMPGATSSVEICDLLSANRQFLHVKRKLGSSQLSHLFSQGAVSTELMVSSPDFRRVSLERIEEVSQDMGLGEEIFRPFEVDAVSAPQIETGYVIVAKWNGRMPSEALPFFSQLNLRRFTEDIRRMGARVTLTPVEVE